MSTLRAAVDLTPAPASVPVARHLVRDLLRAWSAPHDADEAALLVTELVANVVDHVAGEASFTVELTLSDRWLRISVVDGSGLRPVVRELDRDAPRGRGMLLVAGIADRWGVEDEADGKRVWFELAAPDPQEPAGGRAGGDVGSASAGSATAGLVTAPPGDRRGTPRTQEATA